MICRGGAKGDIIGLPSRRGGVVSTTPVGDRIEFGVAVKKFLRQRLRVAVESWPHGERLEIAERHLEIPREVGEMSLAPSPGDENFS